MTNYIANFKKSPLYQNNENLIRKLFLSVVLFILSIPAIYFLLVPGFYEPHDLHHLADIHQMYKAFVSGQIPPRLGPDFTFGYGYPLFNFYYLLPFYLGAIFYILTGVLTLSFKLVFIVTVLVSVYGMYLFLREFLGRWASLAGSILFVYTPYKAVQIYVRGAMGEALALSLAPVVAWAIIKVIKNPKRVNISILAIVIALFIISHNYFFVMALPYLLFVGVVFFYKSKHYKNSFFGIFLSAILGLGMSLYWLLPAIFEQNLVRSETPFSMIDHFPFIKQLIFPSWGYGSSVWGPDDLISFQIGIVNIIVILLLILRFIFFKGKTLSEGINRILVSGLIIGFIITIFLMNIRSMLIWKMLPFNNFVQFPWRLLGFTTFLSSIILGIYVESYKEKFKAIVSLIFMTLSIVMVSNYFRPSKIINKNDNEYLSYFFTDKSYSEDYLLMPIWSDKKPMAFPKAKIESENALITDVTQKKPLEWAAQVNSQHKTRVYFNAYFFPGWVAKVDGKYSKIFPGKPHGQIVLEVAPGIHQIEFAWKETSLRKISDLISVLSFGITVLLFIKKDLIKNEKN